MEYKTRSITITAREDHILEITFNEDWNETDTIEVAKENVEMLKKAIGGRKGVAILGVVPNYYMSKEVLSYYYNEVLGDVARVLLIKSFAARIVGNLYLSLAGMGAKGDSIPTKLFSEKEEAILWLKEQIAPYHK